MPTLAKNADNTWLLTLRNGMKYHFGTDKKITSLADRHCNTITFDNSVADQTTITDPAGRQTIIHFSAGKIDWIKDPAQKQYPEVPGTPHLIESLFAGRGEWHALQESSRRGCHIM